VWSRRHVIVAAATAGTLTGPGTNATHMGDPVQTSRGLTRRRFIARSAALGAAVGLGACGGSSTRTATRATKSLATLAGQLQGRVLLPGSPGYNVARIGFNPRYDQVHPLAIVQAAGAEDVIRTIAYIHERNVEFVVRSTGHSFAGYSTGPGLVLDLSKMSRIAVAPSGERVTVGPGVMLIQLLARLDALNRTVPAGTCPTVGITGLTLGGGIGRMTRKYGLTLDLLRGVEVVDASGRRLTADERTNPDLFWACRGGGGGNFGVVTALEFDTVPTGGTVTPYSFAWPWSHRDQAFAAWQEWSASAPPEFQDDFKFSTSGPDGPTPTVDLTGLYLGPERSAAPHLEELLSSVGAAATVKQVTTTDYVTAVKDVFCKNVSFQQCAPEPLGGKVTRFGVSIKSTFVNGIWPSGAVDVIAEWLERRQRDPVMTRLPDKWNLGKIWFDSLGGAAASVPPGATAYVHREAASCVQYQSRWNVGAPAPVVAANVEWLEGFHEAMAPWNRGAYVNYPDPTLPDYAEQYYGANLPRLQDVKRAYDPENFFHFQQSIPT
jgi:FAD/FMN-containing dehydrogenase